MIYDEKSQKKNISGGVFSCLGFFGFDFLVPTLVKNLNRICSIGQMVPELRGGGKSKGKIYTPGEGKVM